MKFNKDFYKSIRFWCCLALVVMYFLFEDYKKPLWYSLLYFLFQLILLWDTIVMKRSE